jgi:hypothetical protein
MNIKRAVAFGLLLAIGIGPVSASFAQSSWNACTIIVSKLTPDISQQTSSSQRFYLYQQIIADQKYSSYSTANSSSLDVGLSVLGYVDLTLGTKSNASTSQTNWQKFLSLTFAEASASANYTLDTSRWNPDVIAYSCALTGMPQLWLLWTDNRGSQ